MIHNNEGLFNYLRDNLVYEPLTGEIVWLEVKGRRSNGLAGTSDHRGYRVIRLGKLGSHYYHRVAWFLGTGEWPTGVIDHINRDKTDNRLENLRDVTFVVNSWNQTRTELTGVRYRKEKGRWQAYASENGRFKSLGHFKCRTKAVLTRYKYNKERHESYA